MPAIIIDGITVKELDLGTQPPELEILEIGELAEDRARGIFRLQYSGDAEIVLQTKVQANPLNTTTRATPAFTSPNILAADAPLTVPMFLRLSHLKLSGIIILVFSKQKGITLVFRNDPVESVEVSSSFDSIPAVQRFLEKEISTVLRTLFQEDLPAIIHKLSLKWIPSFRRKSLESSRRDTISSFRPSIRDPSFAEAQKLTFPDFTTPLQFSPASIARLCELDELQYTFAPNSIFLSHVIYRTSHAKIYQEYIANQHRIQYQSRLRGRSVAGDSVYALENENGRQFPSSHLWKVPPSPAPSSRDSSLPRPNYPRSSSRIPNRRLIKRRIIRLGGDSDKNLKGDDDSISVVSDFQFPPRMVRRLELKRSSSS